MIPREEWLKKRINECIESLKELNRLEDRGQFNKAALELANELLYATTEWDKYYSNSYLNF